MSGEDPSFACPDCDTYLVATESQAGWIWYCPACNGRLVGAAVLRRCTAKAAFAEVWQQAQGGQWTAGRLCPSGSHPMRTVRSTAGHGPMQVDVCPACNLIWFDRDEFQALPAPPPVVDRQLPPEAAEAFAIAKAEAIAQRQAGEISDEGPEELWKLAPALLGMPVEVDAPESRGFPWLIVWLALVVSAISTAVLMGDPEPIFRRWGTVPAEPWRMLGYTWATCFFLHGSAMHLIGNMYFMLLFGHHLESELGRGRLALLLVVGTFASSMLDALFSWGSPVPAIGASGGISALITCYAVLQPRARFALLICFRFIFRWVNLSCWMMVGLWIILQCVTAAMQMKGLTNVAGWAHLGGAAIGLWAGYAWREGAKESA